MFPVIAVVMVALAAVSAAFGLEGGLHSHENRSEVTEHVLNDVVRSYAKNLFSDLGRQMPVSQVPGDAYELSRISMPHLDDDFGRGSDPEPSPVFELQTVSIGHGDRFRKVEKDVFTVICSQANATAMARVEIESQRARRSFLRPMPGGPMTGSTMNGGGRRSHLST